jgi:hypothetical protein
MQRGVNTEWKFVHFMLDLLPQNSFKVAEEKHEEYLISILGIKTEFNANKLPNPEYRSRNSYIQVTMC